MTIVADPEMLAPYGLQADQRHEAPEPPYSRSRQPSRAARTRATGSGLTRSGFSRSNRQPAGATVRVTSGRYTFSAVTPARTGLSPDDR
jgi:hypothetical protein